jgi:hypothetical protein
MIHIAIYWKNFLNETVKNLINNIKAKYLRVSLLVLLLFYMTNSILASKADSLFLSDEIINIELRTDFSAIQKDRAKKPEYHDGELIYFDANGEPTKLSVKVMARGNFRRDPSNCSFPPLFVNFKKNEVKNTLFDNQDELKLVTPCQLEDDVLKEYLIYKMYNQVTDSSFKVRLAKIQYFDEGSGEEIYNRDSFFIENKEHLAARNNSFEKDIPMTPYELNREDVGKMSVFQYIIGHKDWYVTTRHNIVIMQPNDTTLPPYAVPYDFDFSSFVNAAYTKPRGVPDALLSDRRIYKGICYSPDEFVDLFTFYEKLRPRFESIINNMELISKSKRKQLITYINYFYSVTRNSALVKQEFMDVCETKKDYNISE